MSRGYKFPLRDLAIYAFIFLRKTWTWRWPPPSFNPRLRTLCSCDCLFDSESMECTWQHWHTHRAASVVRTLFPSSPLLLTIHLLAWIMIIAGIHLQFRQQTIGLVHLAMGTAKDRPSHLRSEIIGSYYVRNFGIAKKIYLDKHRIFPPREIEKIYFNSLISKSHRVTFNFLLFSAQTWREREKKVAWHTNNKI